MNKKELNDERVGLLIENSNLTKEVKQLQKENEELRREIKILKEVMTIPESIKIAELKAKSNKPKGDKE